MRTTLHTSIPSGATFLMNHIWRMYSSRSDAMFHLLLSFPWIYSLFALFLKFETYSFHLPPTFTHVLFLCQVTFTKLNYDETTQVTQFSTWSHNLFKHYTGFDILTITFTLIPRTTSPELGEISYQFLTPFRVS